jgi:hypothetical protein
MDKPGDRHAEFDLDIADGVAADNDGSGQGTAFGSAFEDLAQPGQVGILVVGIANQVERGFWLAAHCVDIAERIRRRDLPVHVRIIDNGGKKVDCLDKSDIVGDLVDAGVVVRFGADKQVRVGRSRDVAQNLRNAFGRQFACSASAGGVIEEAFLSAKEKHGSSFIVVRDEQSAVSQPRPVADH